jgi:hypothetical protein
MIHIVKEIKLLLLLGNRMVMTSRLATVGQTYPHNIYIIYIYNIKNSVALDGNPEPDLVHATGCKQPTLSIHVSI